MVEFETMKSEEIKFGNNNFIEIARKKAITEEGSNEFVSLSRGFFTPDGEKRFKRSFAIPDDKEVLDFVSKNIVKMGSGKSLPKPEEKKEESKEEKEEKPEKEAEEKKEEVDEDEE